MEVGIEICNNKEGKEGRKVEENRKGKKEEKTKEEM